MGRLLYGSPPSGFDMDDRALAHVEIVVVAKLRRNESFSVTLDGKGTTRTSIWLNPSSDLQFEYTKSGQTINRAWLESLIESANSPQGLRMTPEPDQPSAG